MDFDITEEQRLLQETIRRFLAERCTSERLRAVIDGPNAHDQELWAGLHELGTGSLLVPVEHGGLASDLLDAALVAEELGYAAAPGPFLCNAMATVAIAAGDDFTAKKRWLERLASGEAIGTVAIGEAASEWRPERLSAKVTDDGLTGQKPLVPYAAAADFLVVAASGADGPGLWLVEAGANGTAIDALRGNDLTRRLDAVTFESTPATRIGGADVLARTIDAGLILVAADAYGGARRCLAMSRSYALEREQFGQVIGAFQAVKHQLAEMATELEPMLAFIWYAAHAFDHLPGEASRHAAMAKARATDVYDRLAARAIELHGGIGFTWEFDLHLWLRRALFDRGFLGDSALHRERAAALAGW